MKKQLLWGALLTSALTMAACSNGGTQAESSETSEANGANSAASASASAEAPAVTTATEVANLPEVRQKPQRVVLSYDGGVMVVDASGDNLEVVDKMSQDGYLRLDPAGDGRHVFVRTGDAFKALDTGAYAQAHGDHFHYYAGKPSFTGFEVSATKPGHIVGGENEAVLFDDGTGNVSTLRLTGMDMVDNFQVSPHHGIGVKNADGTYMVTIADDEGKRVGIATYDADGQEQERFEQCPGAHGAAEAKGGIFVGCTDGGLIYKDGKVTKVAAPDDYGRIGNQASSEDSQYVLGDYKNDKEAADAEKLERPEQVSIINVADGSLQLVDLGTSYTFRSLAMNDEGTAVVLGTDGKLHVIDPEQAKVTRTIDVLDAWEEPEDWQESRPALAVQGDTAYVSDPKTKKLYVVDLTGEQDTRELELPETPDEIALP